MTPHGVDGADPLDGQVRLPRGTAARRIGDLVDRAANQRWPPRPAGPPSPGDPRRWSTLNAARRGRGHLRGQLSDRSVGWARSSCQRPRPRRAVDAAAGTASSQTATCVTGRSPVERRRRRSGSHRRVARPRRPAGRRPESGSAVARGRSEPGRRRRRLPRAGRGGVEWRPPVRAEASSPRTTSPRPWPVADRLTRPASATRVGDRAGRGALAVGSPASARCSAAPAAEPVEDRPPAPAQIATRRSTGRADAGARERGASVVRRRAVAQPMTRPPPRRDRIGTVDREPRDERAGRRELRRRRAAVCLRSSASAHGIRRVGVPPGATVPSAHRREVAGSGRRPRARAVRIGGGPGQCGAGSGDVGHPRPPRRATADTSARWRCSTMTSLSFNRRDPWWESDGPAARRAAPPARFVSSIGRVRGRGRRPSGRRVRLVDPARGRRA